MADATALVDPPLARSLGKVALMYGTDDPRSTLGTSTSLATRGAAAPSFFQFLQHSPAEVSPAGSPTWYVRGQNFVLAYTQLRAGDSLERDQQFEYVALFTEKSTKIKASAGEHEELVAEPAIVMIPPGSSTISALHDTAVVRLFDSRVEDLLGRAQNAADYREPHANVAAFEPWLDPPDGFILRVYPTERISPQQGRFGRIFRSSAFMVNVLDPQLGPRDPEKLSPHHHDDFEQCSLAVEGEYVHHVRTPWTSKRSEWREDDHRNVGSPSVVIIPPPTVHTSEAVATGLNQLIDIFCPPREDFSDKAGWVLNADEYPRPEKARS